jgi:hypothetical protein
MAQAFAVSRRIFQTLVSYPSTMLRMAPSPPLRGRRISMTGAP